MKNNKLLQSAIIFASVFTLPSLSWANPAGKDQIRLNTSTPKKTGDAAFSYMVEWRRGSDVTHRANGLTFISGPGSKKPTTDVEAAKKIAKALNDAMTYESPHDRGATAIATKGKPEVLIANKDGFDFTRVTFRDYSNQELKYSVPGSFSTATKGVAIDIVYFVTAFVFIYGLKQMSSPVTARGGIVVAGIGMIVATLATFGVPQIQLDLNINLGLMVAAILVGSAIAYVSAKRVAMTDMPQMIAMYNGMGGGAAAAIAAVELIKLANSGESHGATFQILAVLGAVIGAISFSGSGVAFAKLQGLMKKTLRLPAHQLINMALFISVCVTGYWVATGHPIRTTVTAKTTE